MGIKPKLVWSQLSDEWNAIKAKHKPEDASRAFADHISTLLASGALTSEELNAAAKFQSDRGGERLPLGCGGWEDDDDETDFLDMMRDYDGP